MLNDLQKQELTIEQLLPMLRKLMSNPGAKFRKSQKPIVEQILKGRDVIAIMPTGGGKSACFQAPAMGFHDLNGGITLVISPLLALIEDQVIKLHKRGIPVACISSKLTLGYEEIEARLKAEGNGENADGNSTNDIKTDDNGNEESKEEESLREVRNRIFRKAVNGEYALLYVTPERLRNGHFIEFAKRVKINMIAVDEAHCISLWGYEFRQRYLEISRFLKRIGYHPIIAAFTATATNSTIEDIKHFLKMNDPEVIIPKQSGEEKQRGRGNLHFSIRRTEEKKKDLLDYLKCHKRQKGFVYCAKIDMVEEVFSYLLQNSIKAVQYYAPLGKEERQENLSKFERGEATVMVSTNALGMGIDISDIRFVIHYQLPLCLENYYQEAGRAGRDTKKVKHADCILYYSEEDIEICKGLIESSIAGSELSEHDKRLRRTVAYNRLKKMQEYAELDSEKSDCKDPQEWILDYFENYDPYNEVEKTELQVIDDIEKIDVLYVNSTRVAQELRKVDKRLREIDKRLREIDEELREVDEKPHDEAQKLRNEAQELRNGNTKGTVDVGRRQKKRKNEEEEKQEPPKKPLTVSYEVTGKMLTYFDLMVADAVYTLMKHRVPVIYPKDVMELLVGDHDQLLHPSRKAEVEESIEKMKNTKIKIDKGDIDVIYKDQENKFKSDDESLQFLPLEKRGKRGYTYSEDKLPPLYEYAEIFNGQFFSIPIKRLNVKSYKEDTLFLLRESKDGRTTKKGFESFNGSAINHIMEFEQKSAAGARSTERIKIKYRDDIVVKDIKTENDFHFDWKLCKLESVNKDDKDKSSAFSKVIKQDDGTWMKEMFDYLLSSIKTDRLNDISQTAFLFREVDRKIVNALKEFLKENGIAVYSSSVEKQLQLSMETVAMTHYLYFRISMMYSPHKSGRSRTTPCILLDTMIDTLNIKLPDKNNNLIDKKKALWEKVIMILEHFKKTRFIYEYELDFKKERIEIRKSARNQNMQS